MRRLTLCALFAFLLVPAAVEAQVSIMAGGGLSTPLSDFKDGADAGWHGMVGLQLGVPVLPISVRADGGYHSFGEKMPTAKTSMLSGALSAVFTLPGVGITPYVLGGVGMYRVSLEGVTDAESDAGFHAAFGVNIGALGFGGFGEVRIIQVQTAGNSTRRFVTATVGIRL